MPKTRSGPLRNVYKLIFNDCNMIKYQFRAGVVGVAESQESTCDSATPGTPALN